MYFFDSYGTRPDKKNKSIYEKNSWFCSKKKIKIKNIKVDYNRIRHQYGNSECVYSINFIKRLLRGDLFKIVYESKVPDKK